ncbi:hypothetical protein ACWGCI_00415 [Streptomyces sp. NPDC054949]
MKRSVTPPPESEERRRVRGRRAAYDYDRREQEAADEMRAEPTQRETSFALPAARWCPHCGDRITGSGYARLGPLPLPGQDSDLVPRLPADRPACRAVAGHPLPGEDE